MLHFSAPIKKFGQQGEKTGWTYIEITKEQAGILNPGVKTAFRVKGFLDKFSIEKIALVPMGDGSFIMPLNASLRKGVKKQKGDTLTVKLEPDREPIAIDADLLACLEDEPAAKTFFQSLTKGHRQYFSRWIESAKMETTKAKRIAMAVNSLSKSQGFPEMLREAKKKKAQAGL